VIVIVEDEGIADPTIVKASKDLDLVGVSYEGCGCGQMYGESPWQ
jgi:glycogen synthase